MSQATAYQVANSVRQTRLPPIPVATKWGTEYKDPGSKPIINLTRAVPGEQPHPLLIERLGNVIQSPKELGGDVTVSGGVDSAAYGNIFGDVAMREALVKEMKHVYGGKDQLPVDVTLEEVALTAGCNAAFMAAVMVIAERGDEIILPVPWYFNHEMTLKMLGIKPVALPVSVEAGFLPTVDSAESLITPHTKGIALLSPNNPSGVTYPPSLIGAFRDFAVKHKLALILDETYRDFVIPGPPHDLFTPRDGWNWRSNLIHLFSFSKSYRVPGHRLGALVAEKSVIEELVKVLDCMHICPPRPLQLTLPPLLPSLRPDLAEQAIRLSKRREIFCDTLEGSGWKIGASGAYFAVIKHPFKGVNAIEVCRRLASECGVVLLPIVFFADEGDSTWDDWIRVAVSNVSDEAVREAAIRIRDSGKIFGWECEI